MSPSIAEVEEAGYALWSTPDRADIDGWVLRSANGFTRRLNSITAVGAPSVSPATRARLESWLAPRSLPLIVRVTPLLASETVDAAVGEWGLRPKDVTHVMGRTIDPDTPRSTVASVCVPDDEFVELLCDRNGRDMRHVSDYRSTIDNAEGPMVGVRIGTDAVGLVGVYGNLSGVFAVAVAPELRRRGLGTEIMDAATTWAIEHGATYQFHQVHGANVPAIAMYRALGYATVYDYHYLQPPGV